MIANLIEPSGKATVEHDEELLSKICRGLAAKSRVQVLGS
jgi:hypothetical protein